MRASAIRWYRLDEAGEPVAVKDASECDWDDPRRHIAIDEIGDAKVSTVFIVLDHDHAGTGIPVLWETLVFGGELDGEMNRYTSRSDAVAGHAAMCEKLRVAQATTTPQKPQP